jgi:hypothetical protein
LADVEETLTYTGSVASITDELLIVNLDDFGALEIEGRTLSYLQENGFSLSPGDDVVINGFMEGDDFEVSGIHNQTTNVEITVREATGRPLWAGGRGGGGNQ